MAGISPCDEDTCDKLKENRLDFWNSSRENSNVNVSELGKLGVPLGIAHKLIEGADMYADCVKEKILKGSFNLATC